MKKENFDSSNAIGGSYEIKGLRWTNSHKGTNTMVNILNSCNKWSIHIKFWINFSHGTMKKKSFRLLWMLLEEFII
jgi:hypothetical protein